MSNDTSMAQVVETARGLDGALVLEPRRGDGTPEVAWGDAFFYFAPDGQVPIAVQPYGTIVTKNYPEDTGCDLDRPDRWRVNIHVGRERQRELAPGGEGTDGVALDSFLSHPLYGDQGWVCVVNPGERTGAMVLDLLRDAHDAVRRRYERRARHA